MEILIINLCLNATCPEDNQTEGKIFFLFDIVSTKNVLFVTLLKFCCTYIQGVHFIKALPDISINYSFTRKVFFFLNCVYFNNPQNDV